MDIRVTDLFSGAGGLSQGFKEASSRFKMVQAVEMDIDAALTYRANFNSADVANVPIEKWLEESTIVDCDVIIGGPPCQGFSTLGKQAVDDEKNLLWRAYAQVVKQAAPRYFVMENVPQFEKSPQKDVFLEELNHGMLKNYVASIHQVNTVDYGSPQSRKRMIILGSRKDCPRLQMPLPILFQENVATVADAFHGLPAQVTETELPKRFTNSPSGRRPGPFFTHELHLTRRYEPISRARFAHIPPGGNRFDLPDDLKSPCWRKHTRGSTDVMGRLFWERPSVTIRTEFFKPEKGRYLHPDEDRAITHHEAARLMGFPDDFKWIGSKTSIARQIGNAVPIQLGTAIGAEILKHFD